MNDNELREDARKFAQTKLGMKGSPEGDEMTEKLVRAAFVARDANSTYASGRTSII